MELWEGVFLEWSFGRETCLNGALEGETCLNGALGGETCLIQPDSVYHEGTTIQHQPLLSDLQLPFADWTQPFRLCAFAAITTSETDPPHLILVGIRTNSATITLIFGLAAFTTS